MAVPAVAEGEETEPPPIWPRRGFMARALLTARRGLSLVLVFAATLAGGYLVLAGFHEQHELSVGEVRLAVDPGHRGAVDLYVPLVDWGARFEAIRAPLRLRVDLQTVNRQVATSVARGAPFNVDRIREEATDALAGYIRRLIALTFLGSLALGLLVAFAIRSRVPRLRWTASVAAATSTALMVALIVLIPPRGEIADPQYYAHGPDIPRALEAVEAAQRATGVLDQELDAQLVGLARLVLDPGRRRSLAGEPAITVASDLHNNTFGLGVLERLAGDGPVFFAGDLTDRGSPLETLLVRRIAHAGSRFVFVSGNHDSDFLSRALAAEGAVVLTRHGRMDADGKVKEPIVVKIDELRVAGYDDPFERKSVDAFADRFESAPNPAMQDEFLRWLRPLIGQVDVVMVHEPVLIETALQVLKDDPPERPLVFVVGHTHTPDLRSESGVTVINGGSIGAGGTGNLAEGTNMSVARFVFTVRPAFQPLAADLVSIDPGTGSSSARRIRLDPEP